MVKATIVVGKRAAEDYVLHEENGIIIDYCDSDKLRKAIIRLWYDDDFRKTIGEAGREFASSLTTEKFIVSIYSLAREMRLNI